MFQWVKDSYHFSRRMASQLFSDNSYMRPDETQALSSNYNERQRQIADANRANAAAKGIAKNAETTVAAVITAPEYVVSAIGLKSAVNIAGRALGAADIGTGTITEDVANHILAKRGEAPLQSLHARFVPHTLPLIGGDEHYQNGGSPDNHPDRTLIAGPVKTGVVSADEFAKVGDDAVDYLSRSAKNIGKALGLANESNASEVKVPAATIAPNAQTAPAGNTPFKDKQAPAFFGMGSAIVPLVLLGVAFMLGPVGLALGAALIGIGAVAGSQPVMKAIGLDKHAAQTPEPSFTPIPKFAKSSEISEPQVPPMAGAKLPTMSIQR